MWVLELTIGIMDPRGSFTPWTMKSSQAMIGENRRLVTDEPVEFEK